MEVAEQGDSAAMTAAKDLTAGYVSGFFGKMVEYPFDTVKVLQQTQGERYKNALDCLRITVAEHGVSGLYKGLLTPLLGAMAENATLFMSYGAMKKLMAIDDVPDSKVPLWKQCVCGAGSGVAVSFVLTPVELVKCKLQAQQGADAAFRSGERGFSGPAETIRHVLRTEGVRGMFKGNVATLAREIPGNVAWFGVYELMCKAQMKKGQSKEDLRMPNYLLSGAASGVAYWSAFYPADTAKSKMQTDSRFGSLSLTQSLRKVYSTEGVRGLYRGWGITAARAAPSHALIFAVYEEVAQFLNR